MAANALCTAADAASSAPASPLTSSDASNTASNSDAAGTVTEKAALRVVVPVYMPETEFEQMIRDAGVTFEAVFKKKGRDRAVVTFANVAAKEDAFRKLSVLTKKDGSTYKISEDTYIRESNGHKRARAYALEKRQKKLARITGDGDRETVVRPVDEVVTPWYHVEYAEQLARKRDIANDCLASVIKDLRRDFKAVSRSFPDLDLKGVPREDPSAVVRLYSAASGDFTETPATQMLRKAKGDARVPCSVGLVVGWQPDGVTGYRNKVDFTIGSGVDGGVAVGYICGRHADGHVLVASAASAKNTPLVAQLVAAEMQDFVGASGEAAFRQSGADAPASGVWRRVLVRVAHASKQVLVAVLVDPSRLEPRQHAALKQALLARFPRQKFAAATGGYVLDSVVWQTYSGYGNAVPAEVPSETLRGRGRITERLRACSGAPLDFQVQAGSFFQVNTAGANVLYRTVAEFLDSADCGGGDRTLADVCCGTGTIGLTLASRFKRVVGFEVVEAAVADARLNAAANGVTNIEFVCGRAEDTLEPHLAQYSGGGGVVAVVDPPRPGLHRTVLNALRACSALDTLVYVSCNAKSMAADLAVLGRPVGGKRPGRPFVPVTAALVDMFPHTPHCECVVLLRRPPPLRQDPAENAQAHAHAQPKAA